MKIDIRPIVYDYLLTIRGDKWSISSFVDFFILFGIPVGFSICTYWFQDNLGADVFLNIFTLFGVFIAVLIAVQAVLVPLYHSPRKTSSDSAVDNALKIDFENRILLIKEISAALSYLQLFSVAGMTLMLAPITLSSSLFLFKWLAVGISAHFLLNILVILKRLHALFQFEFHV